MKITLTYAQQQAALQAYINLDGRTEIIENKPVYILNKFGAHRRAIEENIAALKPAVAPVQQALQKLWQEIFPGIAFGTVVELAPDGSNKKQIADWNEQSATIIRVTGAFDLAPLPQDLLYERNEISTSVTSVLRDLGLIEGIGAAPAVTAATAATIDVPAKKPARARR